MRVQELGRHLLAGAGFADEHHGGERRRDAAKVFGNLRISGDRRAMPPWRSGSPTGPARATAARRRAEGCDRRGSRSFRAHIRREFDKRHIATFILLGHGSSPVLLDEVVAPYWTIRGPATVSFGTEIL